MNLIENLYIAILKEHRLEELQYYKNYNMEDKVELLHELEYKLSKIKQYLNPSNYKIAKNIALRFLKITDLLYEDIYTSLTYSFKRWLNEHPIETSSGWARMILNYYEENFNNYKEEIIENGISWGAITLDPGEILFHIQPDETTKEAFKDYLTNGDGWESYTYDKDLIKRFFKTITIHSNIRKKILTFLENAQFDKINDEFKNNDLVEDFILFLEENYLESYVNDYIKGDSSVASAFITDEVILRAIEHDLYPKYIDQFGPDVEEIIKNVKEALQRLNTAYNAHFNVSTSFQYDENVTNYINEIYKYISLKAVAVSLAMNVEHYSGVIMSDYGELSLNFLDNMSRRNNSDWDEEIKTVLKR